jgi:hypothetical protein
LGFDVETEQDERLDNLYIFLNKRSTANYGISDVRIVADGQDITDDEKRMFDGLVTAKNYPNWTLEFAACILEH